MSFNDGIEKYKKQLKESIEGNVPLSELLNDDFLQESSRFKNYEEFCEIAPVTLKEANTIEDVDVEEMDRFIKNNSDFDSWKDFLQSAATKNAVEKLKDRGFNIN